MAFDLTGLPEPPDLRNWGFVEGLIAEPDAARTSRLKAAEIGAHSVSPATGALVAFLTQVTRSSQIVEVGTGIGNLLPWLMAGISTSGLITTLDADGEHHKVAKEVLGNSAQSIRFITGKPLEVIPRLADASYDLVVLNVESAELDVMVEESVRLLRPSGALVILDALGGGKVGDPAQRDKASVARRLLITKLAADSRFTSALVPVGDGLMFATLNPNGK